jgi:hypothetical protein
MGGVSEVFQTETGGFELKQLGERFGCHAAASAPAASAWRHSASGRRLSDDQRPIPVAAVKTFFHKWLKGLDDIPRVIITAQLAGDGAAKQVELPAWNLSSRDCSGIEATFSPAPPPVGPDL